MFKNQVKHNFFRRKRESAGFYKTLYSYNKVVTNHIASFTSNICSSLNQKQTNTFIWNYVQGNQFYF